MARSKKADKAESNGDSGVTELTENKDGQAYIPGTGPVVVKELYEFAKRHEETKEQHKVLTEKLKSENDEGLVILFPKYKEHFEDDGEGNYIYEAPGVRIKITKPGEMKIATKLLPVETEVPAEAAA